MLVVLSPENKSDNKDFTATFTSPLELSAHSKISLVSAYFPLTLDYDIDTSSMGNEFIINNRTTASTTATTYTVPAGTYNIYQLLDEMNNRIMLVPFDNKLTAFFSFDIEAGVVVFNVVSDGTAAVIDHNIQLLSGQTDDLLYHLGYGDPTITPNVVSISINGQGSAMFPSPPLIVQNLISDFGSVNVAFPSLNIQTLFATGSLRNNNNVLHSIPLDIQKIKFCPTYTYSLGGGRMGQSIQYSYEPTHREECEVNNDGTLILNSLRVQLLDDTGGLYGYLSTTEQKVVIVVNITTEKEKQNDVLRKVKDDKLYEKYSKNFVNYYP